MARSTTVKPGIVTAEKLQLAGFLNFVLGTPTITLTKFDKDNNVSEVSDVKLSDLVGLTENNIKAFANKADTTTKTINTAKTALVGAIAKLREAGLTPAEILAQLSDDTAPAENEPTPETPAEPATPPAK